MKNDVNATVGASKRDGNKLCTYKLFKQCEPCCKMIMSRTHLSSFARCCFGVAPIPVEIGGYERLSLTERICPFCETHIEDEIHIFTQCVLYDDMREDLYPYASSQIISL